MVPTQFAFTEPSGLRLLGAHDAILLRQISQTMGTRPSILLLQYGSSANHCQLLIALVELLLRSSSAFFTLLGNLTLQIVVKLLNLIPFKALELSSHILSGNLTHQLRRLKILCRSTSLIIILLPALQTISFVSISQVLILSV